MGLVYCLYNDPYLPGCLCMLLISDTLEMFNEDLENDEYDVTDDISTAVKELTTTMSG